MHTSAPLMAPTIPTTRRNAVVLVPLLLANSLDAIDGVGIMHIVNHFTTLIICILLHLFRIILIN
jgi:hypothetical protein